VRRVGAVFSVGRGTCAGLGLSGSGPGPRYRIGPVRALRSGLVRGWSRGPVRGHVRVGARGCRSRRVGEWLRHLGPRVVRPRKQGRVPPVLGIRPGEGGARPGATRCRGPANSTGWAGGAARWAGHPESPPRQALQARSVGRKTGGVGSRRDCSRPGHRRAQAGRRSTLWSRPRPGDCRGGGGGGKKKWAPSAGREAQRGAMDALRRRIRGRVHLVELGQAVVIGPSRRHQRGLGRFGPGLMGGFSTGLRRGRLGWVGLAQPRPLGQVPHRAGG